MEFDESGWRVVEDTRQESVGGYLHIGQIEDGDISAEEVTDKVRDNMIRYYYYQAEITFDNPRKLPPLGATPQTQYMQGLSIREREAIGNSGKRAYYA